MGIFSWLFGRDTELERTLVDLYAQMADPMGYSPREARAWAKHALKEAKRDAKKEGTDKLGPDFGDFLLAMESTDPEFRRQLEKIRREGVTDDDIRWWRNMHDLERRMMIAHDTLCQYTAYANTREEGCTPDDAMAKVRKTFPIYGDPDDISGASGDDRPLPIELKDRINSWACGHKPGIRQRVERASSMNAIIRAEIRAGRL